MLSAPWRRPAAAFSGFVIAIFVSLGGYIFSPTAALAAADAARPVIIAAADGRPAHMPTYAGPDGSRVPEGSCAAVLSGRVWVLPCNDPRVAAYHHAITVAAVAAARRRVRRRVLWSILLGTLGVAALGLGTVAAWRWAHRGAPARDPEGPPR